MAEPHALSTFVVQRPIAPIAGPREHFPNGPEFALAVVLHLFLLYVFLLHEPYVLQPFQKKTPVITVELIRKPKMEKPAPEEPEKYVPQKFRNEESGGATYLKSGNAAQVNKGTAPADEEKVAKDISRDEKTKRAVELPDWVKLTTGTYQLPKPRKSSAVREAGRTDANKMSDHLGQGGGESYRNAVIAQIIKCAGERERSLTPLKQFAHRMSFYFVIDRRGALQSLDMTVSSGVRDYDLVMYDIIKQCQPYPPLPDYIEQGNIFPLNIEPNG